MALNIASRLSCRRLQSVSEGTKQLHRDGSTHTHPHTHPKLCSHCRELVVLGQGQSLVSVLKNIAVALQKNKDHRWDGRILYTRELCAQLTQPLVRKMLCCLLVIITSSASYPVFHVLMVKEREYCIFLSSCCTRELSVSETSGRLRRRMYEVNWQHQY